MSRQKIVFLDIDGTLVGYDAKIPPSAFQALKSAKQNGHHLFICSGRPLCAIYPWLLESFPFDGIIASGGGQAFVGERCVFESCFSEDDLTCLIRYFYREGIHFLVSSRDHMYAEPSFFDVVLPAMYAAGYNRDLVDETYKDVIPCNEITQLQGIQKVSFFLSPHAVKKMTEDLHGRYYITDYSVGKLRQSTYFGEISLAGVNKATGIRAVLGELGANVTDAIGIGDSGNDREMLAFVGTSVAMGNATDEIRSMADLVTTAVDEDGIYNAFLQLGLL